MFLSLYNYRSVIAKGVREIGRLLYFPKVEIGIAEEGAFFWEQYIFTYFSNEMHEVLDPSGSSHSGIRAA